MRPVYTNWTCSVRLISVILILCLANNCRAKSTDSTMIPHDSLPILRRLDPTPIRLSEAGARQVLADRYDLQKLRQVVLLKDSLLQLRSQVIAAQRQTITTLNNDQQSQRNGKQQAQSQTDNYRTKLRGARWENWLWRGGAVLILLVKLRVI